MSVKIKWGGGEVYGHFLPWMFCTLQESVKKLHLE